MMKTSATRIGICLALAAAIAVCGAARAQNDTARFYGIWQTSVVYGGVTVTVISVHNASGYANYVLNADGSTTFAGSGTFSAVNGKYTAGSAAPPNDSGTYKFTDNNTIVGTNSAGQMAVWKRDSNPPASIAAAPPSPEKAPTPAPPAAPTQPVANKTVPPMAPPVANPNYPAATNACISAMDKQDFNTAWTDCMSAAQKGDSEAEAIIGGLLFNNTNPPGTGYYAQAEQWLTKSANQGNAMGMDFLGAFYNHNGMMIAGGINPGVNNAPIPPALQAQADADYTKARQWFQKSADKGDGYAMGNLAIYMDAGLGGPKDPAEAAKLRTQMTGLTDPNFAKQVKGSPATQAMTAAWMAGHYADALQQAQTAAAKGNANAEAMLGRAYYEGLGVPESYANALKWLNLAVAKNQPDAMFFLGMMYEYGRGVGQDLNKALNLFQTAAGLGQKYADMQAKGMLMQGQINAHAVQLQGDPNEAACETAGGTYTPGVCTVDGGDVDPYSAIDDEDDSDDD
jgi:TPR repeat protein